MTYSTKGPKKPLSMEQIRCWDTEASNEESLRIIKELALLHAAKGGEQGGHIARAISNSDYDRLCSFDLLYGEMTPYAASNCRQALAYFKKYKKLDLRVDRRAKAYERFWEAEEACEQTNRIFQMRAAGEFHFLPAVEAVIMKAQHKIARVLGDVPSLSSLMLRFGPGATTLTKKSRSNAAEKLSVGFSCSEDLLPILSQVLEEMPHYSELHEVGGCYCRIRDKEECVRVVVQLNADRLAFAEKDASTDRAITIPASVNGMIQLAYGGYMFDRLKRFGVDLRDQSRNQKLALEGSLSGKLATLDLVTASDTVAIEPVFALLPIEWATTLAFSRSAKVEFENGAEISIEKFSSMGNGYTFPLQSLIFWALASSASDDNFASVYGDDIIVSSSSVPAVKQILDVFGLKLNMTKSYWSGPFRESCGVDYHSGINIRPMYQKEVLSPCELFRIHNFYMRNGDLDMALRVKAYIHPELLIYGPDGYGDGHLIGTWTPLSHKRRDSHGYGGALFETYKFTGPIDSGKGRLGDSVLPLYSIYTRESGGAILPDVMKLSENLGSSERNCFLRLWFSRRKVAKFEQMDPSQSTFGQSYHVTSGRMDMASEPLPEKVYRSARGVEVIKSLALPGTNGYKRVSIYTFSVTR